MALSDYQAPSHEFKLKGGSFRVEGLALEQVSVLIQHHLPDIEALFELLLNAEAIETGDIRTIAASLVAQAPGFAANVIAIASGEPTAAPQAAKLPAPVQIDVLAKIGDLTFSEVGGVKKAMEMVAPLLMNNKTMFTKVKNRVKKAG